MKRWKKVLLVVLAAVFLLIPWPLGFDSDGGTAVYGSLLYQITRYHSLYDENESGWGYRVGTSITILGRDFFIAPLRVVYE